MSDIEKLESRRTSQVKGNGRITKQLYLFGLSCFIIFCLFVKSRVGQCTHAISKIKGTSNNAPIGLCPITEKVDPKKYLYNEDTLQKILHDEEFKSKSLGVLSRSLGYRTESFDEFINPNSADTLEDLYKMEPRWKSFEDFHGFLEEEFPLVHKHLKVEKVNKFALVYTWQGTNSSKKPILLAAHMDVVPIQEDTLDQWTHPPFKGTVDGEYLYGRGVVDCKNLLIGLLETVELLLQEGEFVPERTVLLGFGYDEESAGTGADEISKHLLKRYGEDSILQIIDEGNEGYAEAEGLKVIVPATAEKGHLDSIVELFTPGGHSSVPPDHTSIGILARLIARIEDNPFESILTNSNPVLKFLQCLGEHSPSMDTDLKRDILKAHLDIKANQNVIKYVSESEYSKFVVTTSSAVDVIKGGVKSNALPEHVSVLINQRIAIEESIHSTSAKVMKHIMEIARQFDLGVIFDGEEVLEPTKNGYFNYTLGSPLEAAPLTPTDGAVWDLFGGSLRYLYENLMFPNTTDTFVFAPFISTGNTDTKSYWSLTRNIFRYLPGLPQEDSHVHSINERLLYEGHYSVLAFYYYYLQVIDKFEDPLV